MVESRRPGPNIIATPIGGVTIVEHLTHADHRGTFTEVFRDEWDTELRPVQWNVVQSEPGVLRGLHVHPAHADYLMMLQGSMLLQLRDMRASSPTHGQCASYELQAQRLRAIHIPPGVAHGFYFPKRAMHLYAVSHYFDKADELRCRWDDKESGLTWPTTSPLLSSCDEHAGTFRSMQEALDARLATRPAA